MKSKVKKTIFSSVKYTPFQWKDLKDIPFEDDDPDTPEGYFVVNVERFVEETDEEYQERIERNKKYLEISKKMRYDTYLKLKEEFENGF